jgi:hypothetical protein
MPDFAQTQVPGVARRQHIKGIIRKIKQSAIQRVESHQLKPVTKNE